MGRDIRTILKRGVLVLIAICCRLMLVCGSQRHGAGERCALIEAAFAQCGR